MNSTLNIFLKKKSLREIRECNWYNKIQYIQIFRYAFQAFGQGPRACIGMRFALLETKVAIISVLRKFSFKQGTKTTEPLVIDPEYELFWPKGGLWANVELRQDV